MTPEDAELVRRLREWAGEMDDPDELPCEGTLDLAAAVTAIERLSAEKEAAERQLQRIEHYMGYAPQFTGDSIYERVAALVAGYNKVSAEKEAAERKIEHLERAVLDWSRKWEVAAAEKEVAEADADRLAECADHADNCPRWIAARHAPTVYSGAGKCNCSVTEALAAHAEAVAQRGTP